MSPTVWLCRLRLASGSRPGTLARIAHVFAERGISIGEIVAADDLGQPTISLTFASSPKLRDYLARRLGRMPEVVASTIEDARGRSVWDLAPKAPPRAGW